MKPKKDANGNIMTDADGNVIYVKDDGSDIAFDAARAVKKINELNEESKKHRLAAEAADLRTKAFEGVDPEEAKKAMKIANGIKDKTLYESGDVDRLKEQITTTLRAETDKEKARADAAETALNFEVIGGAFARSKFLNDKTVVPRDMVQAVFAKNFKRDEKGNVVAVDDNGVQLLSTKLLGEPAPFEEAVEILISRHPNKDMILKSDLKSGSGVRGQEGSPNGGKTMARSQWNNLDPAAQSAHFAGGGTLTDS